MKMRSKLIVLSIMSLSGMTVIGYAADSGSDAPLSPESISSSKSQNVKKDLSKTIEEDTTAPSITVKDNLAQPMPEEEMTGFSRGLVARSVFTTLIDNREPVDKVRKVPEKNSDVFYFTELRDMTGQTAKHRWEFKGEVIAEVKFNVRGPRWRVWSKKSFIPGWGGDWKVSVLNGANEIISEEIIAFTEATEDVIEGETSNANSLPNESVPSINSNVPSENSVNEVQMN